MKYEDFCKELNNIQTLERSKSVLETLQKIKDAKNDMIASLDKRGIDPGPLLRNFPAAIEKIEERYPNYTSGYSQAPKTEPQTLTAENTSATSNISIAKVNNNIDPNIAPENIKKDVKVIDATGRLLCEDETQYVDDPHGLSIDWASYNENLTENNITEYTLVGPDTPVTLSNYISGSSSFSGVGFYKFLEKLSQVFPGKTFTGFVLNKLDISGIYDLRYTFSPWNGDTQSVVPELQTLKYLDISGADTSQASMMDHMFAYNPNLEYIKLEGISTVNADHIYGMFEGCTKLKELDLSSFDVSKVQGYNSMFKGCASLQSLDLHQFKSSNAYDFSSMFEGCTNLKSLDIRSLLTNRANFFDNMFKGCTSLTDVKFPEDFGMGDHSNTLPKTIDLSDCPLSHESVFESEFSLYNNMSLWRDDSPTVIVKAAGITQEDIANWHSKYRDTSWQLSLV